MKFDMSKKEILYLKCQLHPTSNKCILQMQELYSKSYVVGQAYLI